MTENDAGRQPDLSRLVNLIMENPSLIAEISQLSKKPSRPEAEASDQHPEGEQSGERAEAMPPAPPAVGDRSASGGRDRRDRLLGALKPYLSEDRARALSSIEAIANLIDVMRSV